MDNEVKTLPAGTAYQITPSPDSRVNTVGFVTDDDGHTDYIHGTEMWFVEGKFWRLVTDACHRREDLVLMGVAA